MKNVKQLNIWKEETQTNKEDEMFLQMDVSDLGLSVRSYNCLKRANCNTVQDVLECISEEGQGLRRIRNLGSRSEAEIMQKIQEFRDSCNVESPVDLVDRKHILKPSVRLWDRDIDEFPISTVARSVLKACGVNKVGDLYFTNKELDPGWYAVRELFNTIPNYR